MRKLWQVLMTLVLCIGTVAMLQTAGVVYAETMTVEAGDSRETAAEITVGDISEVTIENEGEEKWFKFTPEEDGAYCFYSEDNRGLTEEDISDPQIFLYEDLADNPLSGNDDANGESGRNFSLVINLEAQKNYYIKVCVCGNSLGSFTVHLTQLEWYLSQVEVRETVAPGEEITITADVVGVEDESKLSYQWYSNSLGEIGSANESAYTFTPSVSDTYYCAVTDADGNTQTVYYYITIDNELYAYIDEPEETVKNISVGLGESATLEVTAGSTDNVITYCWSKAVYNYEDDSYGEWNNLEETGASLAITANEREQYMCTVTDKYGNSVYLYFYIEIDNGLYAYVMGTEDTYSNIEAFPGDSVTFSVNAGCNQGADQLIYHWKKGYYSPDYSSWIEENIDGNESPSFTFNADITANYYCTVKDQFNNETTVHFFVSLVDNNLNVSINNDEDELCVEKDTSITLKGYCYYRRGPIDYEWRNKDGETIEEGTLSDQEDEITLFIEKVSVPVTYILYVKDEYENEDSIEFNISIENAFSAYAEQDDIEAPEGSDVSLKVIADCTDGDLHYQWYYVTVDDEGTNNLNIISEQTEETFTFKAGLYKWVVATVSDDYGNTKDIEFHVDSYGEIALEEDPDSFGYDSTNFADYGDSLHFAVIAKSISAGDPEYRWYESQGEYSEEYAGYVFDSEKIIPGETGSSLSVTAKYGCWRYRCVAEKNGAEAEVEFEYRTSDLQVDYQEEYTAAAGDTLALKVDAKSSYGTLEYIWARLDEEDGEDLGEDNPIEITVEEGTSTYRCNVYDDLIWKAVYITVIGTSSENAEAVNNVASKIDALKPADSLTLADKSAVVAARKAYDALTPEQKKLVSSDTLNKLKAAEEKITALETAADNKTKADAAINAINALKPAASLTAADKAAVQAARKAYDALTADQKKLVSADTLKKLTDAEQKISDLEKAAAETKPGDNGGANGNNQAAADKTAADAAAQSITALKSADTVTLADKAAVEAARAAYDKLTDTQKKLVPADTLKKLTDAEAKIAALEQEAANAVQKGKVYTVSNMNYKVTNADMKGKGTVTLTGTKIKKNKLKKLKVPAAVKINGATFKVTAIGNNAFKKFTRLGSVTIGANVTSIGNNAFANDSALIKVTIGKSVTKIGKAAFSGDKKLKSIIIKSAKLKSVGKKAINGIQKKATIKVPKKQLKKYKKLFKASTGFKKTMKIK